MSITGLKWWPADWASTFMAQTNAYRKTMPFWTFTVSLLRKEFRQSGLDSTNDSTLILYSFLSTENSSHITVSPFKFCMSFVFFQDRRDMCASICQLYDCQYLQQPVFVFSSKLSVPSSVFLHPSPGRCQK